MSGTDLPDVSWEYNRAVTIKSGKFLKFVEEEKHMNTGEPALCLVLSLCSLSPLSERDALTPGLWDTGARPLPSALKAFYPVLLLLKI